MDSVELPAGEGLPDVEDAMEHEGRQEHQRRPLGRRQHEEPERHTCHLVEDDGAGVSASHPPCRRAADRDPDGAGGKDHRRLHAHAQPRRRCSA